MKTSHKPYKRSERVNDALKSILANIFISNIHIPESGLITITNVVVTKDLKYAKIYVSFLNNLKSSNELIKVIISKKNIIKNLLGKELTLKFIPELRFYHDDTIKNADKINRLINTLTQND